MNDRKFVLKSLPADVVELQEFYEKYEASRQAVVTVKKKIEPGDI